MRALFLERGRGSGFERARGSVDAGWGLDDGD